MAGTIKKLLWIAMAAVLALGLATLAVLRYRRQPLTLVGAVTVQDSDYRNQVPLADVEVRVANDLAAKPAKSDSVGFFSLRLFKHVRRGHPITLEFRRAGYEPLDLNETVGSKLYIARLVPIHKAERRPKGPGVAVGGVVVRFTVKTLRSVDVGSAVKTFDVANKADVPCDHGPVCSPDGRWKASMGSVTLNAGPGNEFHDARLSCIAGTCPFTRIESDDFSKGGQTLTASVRNWGDTTTFLAEAEVNHFMVGQTDHRSYPVIFGSTLSFTLPNDAEGVSLEADVAGQSIIFPLGPDLLLTWATCSANVNKDLSKLYHCQLKPGYHFQP
jgi:hypothetical protein